jgi:MarR family transcriptional regulator, 2-MHQ and catechol-resistance regulon repressor
MESKCKNQPFLALMKTAKNIQDQIRSEMSANNLSITEFSVLEVLHQKGMQTIHQVGQSILISSGSMTYVIDKLEQKGMLERRACPSDRRAIHLALTDTGMALMEEIMPRHQRLIDGMFESLSEEERESIVALLNKIK